jgi:hypothetical protein
LRRKRSSLLEENLLPESIEALKRNQDVWRSFYSAPRPCIPSPGPPSPVSSQSWGGGGLRGWARSQMIRQREWLALALHYSFNILCLQWSIA